MGNAFFDPILQCVPRYTATRIVSDGVIQWRTRLRLLSANQRWNCAAECASEVQRGRWRAHVLLKVDSSPAAEQLVRTRASVSALSHHRTSDTLQRHHSIRDIKPRRPARPIASCRFSSLLQPADGVVNERLNAAAADGEISRQDNADVLGTTPLSPLAFNIPPTTAAA